MPSERIKRQINRLLNKAEEASAQKIWPAVREKARQILTLDPNNVDAKEYLAAADRATYSSLPTSFVGGRYSVKRMLGEGGKKKVYLVHDTSLERDVAFALIKTEGLNEGAKQRIISEARVMARLSEHPNVMPIYDFGSEKGQLYLVVPVMHGGDLEGLINKAPDRKLPLERIITLGIEICEGLEFTHKNGVVHRDLKPANIWLTADGIARIGDFGLAVTIDRNKITEIGFMVGTPHYMAPEQATGGEVTLKADLYALGAVLYEMVTGQPPFVADEPVGVIVKHLNEVPLSPRRHNSQCPSTLETLILDLLEKDPEKRPNSANEVRRILESILSALNRGPEDETGSRALRKVEFPGTNNLIDSALYRRTFVGRETELAQLQDAFDGAFSGQGSLVTIVGEPGIGKTALAEQLSDYVTERGGKTLTGHCYEEGSLSQPYLAFVEALRLHVIQSKPVELRKELGPGAADVARIVPEIRDFVAIESTPHTFSGDARWQLLQAVTNFIRNIADIQPLLVVLEDLHWADRGTLDILVHVSRNLVGARLLVIGTYRDIEVNRTHPLSTTLAELRRVSPLRRVQLRGLDIPEVHKMLISLAGCEIPLSLAEAVHRQTEGNPLFIQEVIRYLMEEDLITKSHSREPRISVGTLKIQIPDGLRDVIGKRLSRLSRNTNRLLATAAVIGRDFDLVTLEAVVDMDHQSVLKSLEEATRVGILQEQARPGTIRYRFEHAFFRQTLYEELIAARRLSIHQKVAHTLELQYGSHVDEHSAELAEHFLHSTDRNDLKRAVDFADKAAQRAVAIHAYGEAVRLLEQALDIQEVLDSGDDMKHCGLLLSLGNALIPAGDPKRAYEEIAEEAFKLAEALKERQMILQACRVARLGLEAYGSATLRASQVFQKWADRLDLYTSTGTTERVQADIILSLLEESRANWSEHRRLAEKVMEEAHALHDSETLFSAASLIINFSQAPQHLAERLALTKDFVNRPYQGVSASRLSVVLFQSGLVYLACCDRDAAEGAWNRINDLALRIPDPFAVIMGPRIKTLTNAIEGRLEEAVNTGYDLVRLGDELGSPVFARQVSTLLTWRPLVFLGRTKEALESLPTASNYAGVKQLPMVDAIEAVVQAHQGQMEESREKVDRLVSKWKIGVDEDETPTEILTNLLEAAVLVRDLSTARLLAKRLVPATSSILAQHGVTCVARHLGDAASLLGQHTYGMFCYKEAERICSRVRLLPEVALARLGMARLLDNGILRKALQGLRNLHSTR